MPSWEFIATEFTGSEGEEGERRIWEAVTQTLKGTGEGVGIFNYRTFCDSPSIRYEPDILLVSRDWGLVVIEVKACWISQIKGIRATQWEMQKFYKQHLYPFQQGEKQLRAILRQCDHYSELKKQIPGRVIVALPSIGRDEWRDRGFEDDHHTCPPIIFGDELSRRTLLNSLEYGGTIIERGASPLLLNDNEWNLFQKTILGPKPPQPTPFPPTPPPTSRRRADVLVELRNWTTEIDIQQARIGLQIPPGPQRIRGIAGSGKTLLLAQKAARMHVQHPEWDIALVFFTRSLHQLLPDLVRQWLVYWSGEDTDYDFCNGKLKILHAWGCKERPGLYSLLRDSNGGTALVIDPLTGSCTERLAASCRRLLNQTADNPIKPVFDAVLIDEGQDLAVGDEWKYQDKQAIYWLAWQALRPVETAPDLRRLIWAYDEAQSLDTLKIPSYKEVFGEELGSLLSGSTTGPIYKGGIHKSAVMKRCYRTPAPILTAAHAIGMGLLRKEGMLSGFTTREDWDKIGYKVQEGCEFRPGRTIKLHRPAEHSPNPLPQVWGKHPLEFEVYEDRESQLDALAKRIQRDIDKDGLQPSRDLLIIVLGADGDHKLAPPTAGSGSSWTSLQLQQRVANTLHRHGIDYYLPGATKPNRYLDSKSKDADRFWHDGAVTVSQIYRAKGHEAPMVYVVGLELVAQDESNLALRNQLFVALTRSMAWVHLSGIKDPDTHTNYLLYDEMRRVIDSGDTFKFTYRRPPKRALDDGSEL